MNLKKNYYQVLGIEHNSDTGTIKKAYYKLSKQHHPDKGGDAKIFNEINEA
jgi:curved DNA-binding protein CbpA